MFYSSQLINVSSHVGSSKQSWLTMSSRFVFGFRKGITIINISYTSFYLRRSLLFVQKLVSKGGVIIINNLFIKTNSYLINRFYSIGQIVAPNEWIGGYLSNYRSLKKKIISRKKSSSFVSALINLNYQLDNRFVSNEAKKVYVPIVSIFDTNSRVSIFDYPIPTNSKSSSVRVFYAFLFSSAVFSGIIRKVVGLRHRSIISILKNSSFKYFNSSKYIHSNLLYKNKSFSFCKKKKIYFYVFPFFKNKFSVVIMKIFFSKFKRLISKNFFIIKKRFFYKEIITNIDILEIIINKKVENKIYRINNLNYIKFINSFSSKSNFFLKRISLFKIFSNFKRLNYIAVIKFINSKKLFLKLIKEKFPIIGSTISLNFKKRDFIGIQNVFVAILFYKFFVMSTSIKIFPWRVEYPNRKRYFFKLASIIFKSKKINFIKVSIYLKNRIRNTNNLAKKIKFFNKMRFRKIFNLKIN